MREIEQVSTNTVTLKSALNASTNTGDVVYGAATYYLTQNPSTSLQFILEGAEPQDRWRISGVQLDKLGIAAEIAQIPKLNFSLKGATWDALASAALGVASYTLYETIHTEGYLYTMTAGSSTLVAPLDVSAVTFEPALSYVPVTSPSGTETIARWRRNRTAPVITGTLTLPYQTQEYLNERESRNLRALFFQMGKTAGETVLISIPTYQITNVAKADTDGINAQTITFAAQLDSDTTETAATDLGLSAFRIHLG
jgi:hypothetical protein